MSTTERTRATAFGLIKEGEREQSGAFPIAERDSFGQVLTSDLVIAELAPELVSLIPEPPPASVRPRAATPSERAELVIEDLSLAPDNPYLASSLVPPPKRPFPVRKAIAIAGGMLAAAAAGAAIQLMALRLPHAADAGAPSSAGVTAPAPVAVASPREVIDPPAAVLSAPVAPSAVAPLAAAPAAPVAMAAQAEQPEAVESSKPIAAAATEAGRAAIVAGARAARVALPAPPEPVLAPKVAVVRVAAPEAAAAPELAPAPADLPSYPTREQVTAGFESVRSALAQCAGGQGGVAQIKATISNNGRISYALVGGDFDGSAAGSCMAKAVREAQFPAFAEPRLKVTYPFAL